MRPSSFQRTTSISAATARPKYLDKETAYTPSRGDVVRLDLTSHRVGHEQCGDRYWVVLSNEEDHRRTGMACICPITTQGKGLLHEVALPNEVDRKNRFNSNEKPVRGFVLVNQVISIDIDERQPKLFDKLTPSVVDKIAAAVCKTISK